MASEIEEQLKKASRILADPSSLSGAKAAAKKIAKNARKKLKELLGFTSSK